MPIVFNTETKAWELNDPSQDEISALLRLGKQAIIVGIGEVLYDKQTKNYLTKMPADQFFNA